MNRGKESVQRLAIFISSTYFIHLRHECWDTSYDCLCFRILRHPFDVEVAILHDGSVLVPLRLQLQEFICFLENQLVTGLASGKVLWNCLVAEVVGGVNER